MVLDINCSCALALDCFLTISCMVVQELKRKEDAIQRGFTIFLNGLKEIVILCHVLLWNMNHLFCFGSWYCYRGEELATIFSYYPSWHWKWNTNSSPKDPVCCIHNIFGYVQMLSVFVACHCLNWLNFMPRAWRFCMLIVDLFLLLSMKSTFICFTYFFFIKNS